ncbi:hypothetical protein [Flavobacterium sp.]|uniref:hypothetical protein n=1 Tax=Flavobacterium sp. TaxID=239 RepID=UPI0012024825|nr:hypothetical protein [Flavobacterium sp.]RZJ73494.1 MAG: hypothetical protein EOO49_01385 [Flavobacterium sp.]
MTKVLYIGRHPEILETVLRLINGKEDWFALGAESDEEAISLFQKHDFDIVLLGCGLSEECENQLTSTFKNLKPEIAVVLHYGGGSGLLTNELLSALT